jgi:transcriptional regulator with XRE-family HTH domain
MFDMIDANGVLAANVRRLRIACHLSLSELARATGIGKATLSSIENGRANPTVGTLRAIADALRVPIAELLEEPELGEIRVVRAGRADGPERMISDGVRELTLSPNQRHESPPRAAGAREELFVVEGKLIAGPHERITELATGDFASFPADVARVYETGRQAARALAIVV